MLITTCGLRYGVSRHHCVVRTAAGWVITDDQAPMARSCNDVADAALQLRQGDLVQIGPLVFRFVVAESAAGWDSTSPCFAPGSDVGVVELQASIPRRTMPQADAIIDKLMVQSAYRDGELARGVLLVDAHLDSGIALGLLVVAGLALYGCRREVTRSF